MTFKSPDHYELEAREVCDLLGITDLTPAKFRKVVRRIGEIRSSGADFAYARLGFGIVRALHNLEDLTAAIRKK